MRLDLFRKAVAGSDPDGLRHMAPHADGHAVFGHASEIHGA